MLSRTIVVLAALTSAVVVHAQCGYQPQMYGGWQPMVDVVWQPAPGLTIGFSTGPIYGGGFQQPYFIPPPIFYGNPQYGYGNNWDGGFNSAYQQGYDSRWRQRAQEQQDEQDRAARAAGRRAADRAWGIGPTYGHRRY